MSYYEYAAMEKARTRCNVMFQSQNNEGLLKQTVIHNQLDTMLPRSVKYLDASVKTGHVAAGAVW